MGLHHRREDDPATVALAPIGRQAHSAHPAHSRPRLRLVPHDAPPAGLGYPAPTAYRPDPVTGAPTPPRGTVSGSGSGSVPAPALPPVRRRPARTGAPLAVAVAGAAVALVGMGSQLPGLVEAVTTSTASAPGAASTPSAPDAAPAPAVAQQCATVVADALDDTVAALGRAPSSQWSGVLAAQGDDLAATYGDTSREHRAFERGADDILTWLREDSAEDYPAVTARVARTVASTCGA